MKIRDIKKFREELTNNLQDVFILNHVKQYECSRFDLDVDNSNLNKKRELSNIIQIEFGFDVMITIDESFDYDTYIHFWIVEPDKHYFTFKHFIACSSYKNKTALQMAIARDLELLVNDLFED